MNHSTHSGGLPPPLEAFTQVLGFDVPPSHRARWGSAITTAKRLGTVGLGPVQRLLLSRQVHFNALLASLLRQPERTLPERARRELAPLADPLPLGVKAAWLPAAPGLREQQSWNGALVALLSGQDWPLRTDGVRGPLDALDARCDVLASQPPGTVGLPLWREVWRRQIGFNHACVRTLRHMLGAARPVLVMPEPEAYARAAREQEARDVRAATTALEGLTRRPLISLVTPAWETPVEVLQACIASVTAQVYPHWELCIVDDGSRGAGVAATLRRLAAGDARIRFERLPENQGIARATNAALAMARGEFVGFLDHDDLLAPHALAEVALRLASAPDTEVLYSDEDKVDAGGQRFAPYLKPELSPELLRAVNYVCHFLVVRTSLLREVGGIRPGFEGAQDHELLLRLMERTRRFAHIPKVLYHWRTLPGSTATDASAKPAASEAGRRAVTAHLERAGEAATVETSAPGLYRIRRSIAHRPRVSVLLSGESTEAGLESLLALTDGLEVEVLVPVFGGREPGAAASVASPAKVVRVRVERTLTPGAVANRLLRASSGDLVLSLDAGTLPTEPGWLAELSSQALRPDVGVVGARILSPEGHVLHAGLCFGSEGRLLRPFAGLPDPSLRDFGGSHWPRDLLAVSSACAMIRRDVLESLGGWDESFTSDDARGAELCLRVGARGLRVLYTPHARLVRTQARSDGDDARDAPRLREAWTRHPRTPRGDPFGHPCLEPSDAEGTDR
ncbi:glycosyltransferase [Corallococcus praedator]|uniref:Glycosyltransferase n=1 Tax=Corallococcus praedator TaxID=2316724 RepID=A0ABX9QPZ2_9BACT|nr:MULTISPECIES: glycosyltransferase [Corallococcus]RKH36259.1 glycosyltransferase [Corallococcus sp. CA031C]RKI13758.1 glycosyltransferase [Corallococcus praedator]